MRVLTLGENSEDVIDTSACLGTRAEVLAANPHGIAFGFFQRDLSVGDIAFIPSDENGCVLREVPLEFLDPDVDLGPRLHVSNIVHNECALGTLVVDLVERVVSLLAGGVPNVDRDLLSLAEGDCLAETTRVHRTYLLFIEVSLAEAKGQ
jgi:hypothetical protein